MKTASHPNLFLVKLVFFCCSWGAGVSCVDLGKKVQSLIIEIKEVRP